MPRSLSATGGYPLESRPEGLKRQQFENLPQVPAIREYHDPTQDDEDVLYPTSRRTALQKFLVGTIAPRPVNRKEPAHPAANVVATKRAHSPPMAANFALTLPR
jgi:hypothetical protein